MGRVQLIVAYPDAMGWSPVVCNTVYAPVLVRSNVDTPPARRLAGSPLSVSVQLVTPAVTAVAMTEDL